jgi:hypothetical protein
VVIVVIMVVMCGDVWCDGGKYCKCGGTATVAAMLVFL